MYVLSSKFRLTASSLNQNMFACFMGLSGTGKTEISKDFSKAVAKPYCNFKCCELVQYKTISTFLKVSERTMINNFIDYNYNPCR